MKYYSRNTHDFNNLTREWEYKNNDNEKTTLIATKSLLGIHALDSGRWHTLNDIVDQNQRYYEQFHQDPYSGVTLQGCSTESILYDLERLEKAELIKTKET
jgi:hypothetical protein